MGESGRERRPSEVLKRGYADRELDHIYALGRFYLENGDLQKAKNIFSGIIEVAPDYAYAWLGMTYINIQQENIDQAIFTSKQALHCDSNSLEALLFQIACLLSAGDLASAGAYLGEVGDKVESGHVESPNLVRFYKAQLARYKAKRTTSGSDF